MKRQILIGLVLIGNTPVRASKLTEDQLTGVINDDLGKVYNRGGVDIIQLTEKGRKIYNALEAVTAIGTNW